MLKRNINCNIEKIIFFIFALSVLLTARSYFMWEGYNSSFIRISIKAFRYVGLGMMLLFIVHTGLSNNFKRMERSTFILIVALLLTFMHMNLAGAFYRKIFNWDHLIVSTTFAICFALDCEQRSRLYEIFMKLFVIFTLPSIIYYVLVYFMGIGLPFTYLSPDHVGKLQAGIFYELRTFGLIINPEFGFPRPCGIFDEPGVIGTICAFLFSTIWVCNKNRKWAKLLLLEGALSMSLAFYIMMVVFYISLLYKKNLLKLLSFVFIVCMLGIGFYNFDFENQQLRNLQQRIDLSSSLLVRDNRTDASFDYVYNEFLQHGGYAMFMGNGVGATYKNNNTSSSSSYKCIVYDHGIIGAFLYFGFFVLLYFLKYKDIAYTLPFFSVFIVSLYQRPYVLNEMMLFIYITAFAYITTNQRSTLMEKGIY